MKFFVMALGIVVGVGCFGCNQQEDVTVYTVEGVVKEVNLERPSAVIRHEEIPGYMAAMTMPFPVKKKEVLEGIEAKDRVRFQLHVTDDRYWIEALEKTGVEESAGEVTEESGRNQGGMFVREIEEGDPLPDYIFTNELGKAMSLEDYEGKAVGLTFLFTRCPLPDFCPRMAQGLAEAQKWMSQPEVPANWQLLALTIDPGYDRPEVLREYGKRYDYNPARWSFLTGDEETIDRFAEQFGVGVFRNGSFPEDHKLRTVVIGPDGVVRKIFIGNEWTGEELAEALREAQGKE